MLQQAPSLRMGLYHKCGQLTKAEIDNSLAHETRAHLILWQFSIE